MFNAFKPNKSLTGTAWTVLLIVESAVFIVAWVFGDTLSIPGPLDTLTMLGRLVRNDGLLYELWVSMKINYQAIGISTLISVGLAYLTVLPVMRPIVSFISKARFFSLAGFVTLFTFIFGGGHGLKVSLLTFGITVFFVTSMAAVIAAIPKTDWDQARSLRMAPWRSVVEVVLLGRADEAFEMLRQNAAMGWMMLTMVEGLSRTEGGIGGIMINSTKYRQFSAVFAVQLVVLIVGILQDQGFAKLKDLFCPHSNLTLERQ